MMKHKIIQCAEDLPNLPEVINELFLDAETTSGHPKKKSVNPHRNCEPCGWAFTFDDCDTHFYLPIKSNAEDDEFQNCPELSPFIQQILSKTKLWVNHNIKYDMHVAAYAGFKWNCPVFDTLTQAKLYSSDRFRYDEETLAKEWLGIKDGGEYKEAFAPWLNSSKDFGDIPISLMGPYACHDVWEERQLYHFLKKGLPEDVQQVSALENKVTECLFDTEHEGFRIDPTRVMIDQVSTLEEMEEIVTSIQEEHGIMMRPNVNEDCWAILHCQYGLPVIAWTDNTKEEVPSYDKNALKAYLQYPEAPKELIEKILRYRQMVSHNGYLSSLLEHESDGYIHSSYNQAVRTGRMSCKEPNNQQWNEWIKRHVLPDEGRVFLSCDFSSIEFRIISHYLSQPEILAAYKENPDTDFHQWVADMCQVTRSAAKNINFAIAFGGGKARVLKMLSADADIIANIVASTPEEFQAKCRTRANNVFGQYHRTLYKLRETTKLAASRLKSRGYVRNAYGRRRHLPPRAAFRAFNTVVQSSAADKMKESVIETSPRFNKEFRDLDIRQHMFVHDEILFSAPKECEKEAVDLIRRDMIGTERFLVPMRVDIQPCHNNWAESCG